MNLGAYLYCECLSDWFGFAKGGNTYLTLAISIAPGGGSYGGFANGFAGLCSYRKRFSCRLVETMSTMPVSASPAREPTTSSKDVAAATTVMYPRTTLVSPLSTMGKVRESTIQSQ